MDKRKRNPRMIGVTRRRFLGTLGVAGTAAIGFRWPDVIQASPARQANPEDNFGRMFDLPPFSSQSPNVEAALMELGKPVGILDAKDSLATDRSNSLPIRPERGQSEQPQPLRRHHLHGPIHGP